MAKFSKTSHMFIFLLLLLSSTAILSSLAEDNTSEPEDNTFESEENAIELDAEMEEGVELVDENGARVIGGSAPININIQPVKEDELDCSGLPDGVVLQDNPVDCLFFYICIAGSGHKIECPRIPGQTYFNPERKTCGDASATYCQEVDIAQLRKNDEEAAAAAKEKEEAEKMAEDQEDYSGEDYSATENLSESRIEL